MKPSEKPHAANGHHDEKRRLRRLRNMRASESLVSSTWPWIMSGALGGLGLAGWIGSITGGSLGFGIGLLMALRSSDMVGESIEKSDHDLTSYRDRGLP